MLLQWLQDFSMADSVRDNIVLHNCVKDILAQIKPVEDDRSKRLSTIQELENCIHSLESLTGNLHFFVVLLKPSRLCLKSKLALIILILVKVQYYIFDIGARVDCVRNIEDIFFTVCACCIVDFLGRLLKGIQIRKYFLELMTTSVVFIESFHLIY
jgi:hypothetical protein